MIEKVKQLVNQKMHLQPTDIKRIGGGYYGDVHKVTFDNAKPVIIKLFKIENLMKREVEQLDTLRRYSLFPMPDVLWTHDADDFFKNDVIAMNFLQGIGADTIRSLNPRKRAKVASQIVDNLIAYHNVHNPNGFGEINGNKFYPTFNECYRERATLTLSKSKMLLEKGELSQFFYDVMCQAMSQFDDIFYLPITESSLIHGDYNTWNIMVDIKTLDVTAIIDPCNCMWADSEMDLYQLNNSNGKHLGLLKAYAKKKPLSKNFSQKSAFYEMFTEIEHYANSGNRVNVKFATKHAKTLKKYLQ